MNGLKFLRIRCNYSLSELSEAIGVSRQMLNAWENGKKPICAQRKKQLSEFFGIDEKYFNDISESEKEELLCKAMYEYIENGTEKYKYKFKDSDKDNPKPCFPNERTITKSEELKNLQRRQKDLLNEIDRCTNGKKASSISNQMGCLNRGIKVYELCNETYNLCFSAPSRYKIMYFRTMVEVLTGLNLSFNPDSSSSEIPDSFDKEFIEDIRDFISKRIEYKKEATNKACMEFDRERRESGDLVPGKPLSPEEIIKEAEEEVVRLRESGYTYSEIRF